MSMYLAHFGLTETPFTITPNPRYLFMSDQHREAMAHLSYGVNEGGGFVQLTGEVGTGKTTICRCMLNQLPKDVDVALITNPRISEMELLATLCDELRIKYPEPASSKVLLDRLNQRLLEAHAAGRRTVLIIDEAQNLSRQVLERVRLLTNLETAREKLLQIILIGQPELSETLDRPDLRQLAQRITARYHLAPLTASETADYINHRLTVAGCQRRLFSRSAVRAIYRASKGVPRIINVICDRALLGAFAANEPDVDAKIVKQSVAELYGDSHNDRWLRYAGLAVLGLVGVVVAGYAVLQSGLLDSVRGNEIIRITAAEKSTNDAPAPQNSEESTLAVAGTAQAAQQSQPESAPVPPIPGLREVGPAAPTPIALATSRSEVVKPMESADGFTHEESLLDLVTPEAQTLTLDRSFRRLAGMWGVSLGSEKASICELAARQELKCLNANGDWDNLRRFDRPALLSLDVGDGERRYAIVRDLDAKNARMVIGDREHWFSLGQIESIWTGDYIMLWRPPTGSTNLKLGASGDDVLWLRRAMNFVASNGDSVPIGSLDRPEFDEELEGQVIRFQEQYALGERGNVGAETLITLNSRLNSGMPRLKRY